MDIKCNTNPNYFNNYQPHIMAGPVLRGRARVMTRVMSQSAQRSVGNNADIFVRRPVAEKSATGLLGLCKKIKDL